MPEWENLRTRKISSQFNATLDSRGNAVLNALFRRKDCEPCENRPQCTSSASRQRAINVKPQPLFEALKAARERQETDAFKELYEKRAGIEGTLSQAVRAFGLRRAHYRGYAKTCLQHIATATAINLVRLAAWWTHPETYTARKSAFVRAMEPGTAQC